jgi:GNAT superfamily N-acetyltransferase
MVRDPERLRMDGMTIEPVLDECAIATVERLARHIWMSHYVPIIGRDQVEYMLQHIQSRSAIAQQIAAGACYGLLYYHEQASGYVCFESRPDYLFLSKLYVEPQLQGKGLGRHTLHWLEAEAMARGLTRMALSVNKDNLDSIAAYRAWGFETTGSICIDIGGGFFMDDYWMEKTVAAPAPYL